MKYTLFSRNDEYSNQVCTRIRDCFSDLNGFSYDDHSPDLVICVGGDGTILRAIHFYLDQLDRILFVGIHTGTLGFFTDYTNDELDLFIHDVLCHQAEIEKSPLLELKAENSDDTVYAFNEFRIGSFKNTVSYEIYIDGEFLRLQMEAASV